MTSLERNAKQHAKDNKIEFFDEEGMSSDVKSLELAFIEGAKYQKKKSITIACDVYCDLCDTKECEGSYECNWVKRFKRMLEKAHKQ